MSENPVSVSVQYEAHTPTEVYKNNSCRSFLRGGGGGEQEFML